MRIYKNYKSNKFSSIFLIVTFVIAFVLFQNQTTVHASSSNLNPYASIDTPGLNSTISGDSIDVNGWALNSSGIKQIKVYIDNVYKGTATYGISRPDVSAIFKGYPDGAQCGFSAKLDISNLTTGTKDIRVEQIGNDGTVNNSEQTFYYNRVENLGSIDSPYNNAVITGTKLNISGWSINIKSISAIKLYIDGVLKGTASYGISRPDVANAFPNFSTALNCGYSGSIDLSGVENGTKVLKVEQVSSDGTSYSFERTFSLNILESKTNIDSPENNQIIKNNELNVSGWSISGSKISNINVYIDGVLKATTTTGIQRIDVANVFQAYSDIATSGYATTVDLKGLSDGNKVVKVEQVNSDGTKSSTQKTITLNRTNSRINIDSPSKGTSIGGNLVNVFGWALNLSRVSKVNIYLDGQNMGEATYGFSRPDVANVFPEYGVINSGFMGIIDITSLTDGTKTLKVETVAEDGSIDSLTQNITIANNKSIITIDAPLSIVTSDLFAVSGWALNTKSTSSINVYIDGVLKSTTTTGMPRFDVARVFTTYSNAATSGYITTVNLSGISDGDKVIKVEQVCSDGSKSSVQKTITVNRK